MSGKDRLKQDETCQIVSFNNVKLACANKRKKLLDVQKTNYSVG